MQSLKNFRIYLCLLSIVCVRSINAQIKEVFRELKKIEFNTKKKVEERHWKSSTNFQLNFGQQHYENWVGGDAGKIEIFGKINQKLTYQTEKVVWDNNLEIIYGINKNHGDSFRKSSDQITLNSIFGKKVNENFSYSFFFNLQTQLTNTYHKNDEEKNFRLSGLAAPLYLAGGPGIMWRWQDHWAVNIAPSSLKATYLKGITYKYRKDRADFISSAQEDMYGIAMGEKINYRWGLYAQVYTTYTLLKNIKIENRLSLYSNYLENPKNIDLDNTLNINFKINKLLSTNLVFQTIYDDDVYSRFQIRQHFGLGFNLEI